MLYNPLNIFFEKARLLFKERVQDGQLAYLGDTDGPGARVEIPDFIGHVYARFPGGKDANGNVQYSTPFPVRAPGTPFVNAPGTPVYVAKGRDGAFQIVEAHYASMDQAGIDTRILNPLHQQSKWVYLWQFTLGMASAVANSVTTSYLVTIKKFLHYSGNVFQYFETGEQADKIDLQAYVPGVDMQCYAAVWLDTYTNTAEVTTSTAQSLFSTLDGTDINELVADRPPDAIPHKAFWLANDQGTVTIQAANDIDLRQFLNMPQLHGFNNPVAYRERIQPDRQQLFTGILEVTGTLEVLGVLVGVPSGCCGGGSGGTVTSVGLSEDTDFLEVGSSPVTSAGTITLNRTDGLTANRVVATPDNATGKVTTRALVDRDIPDILTLTQINDTNGNEQVVLNTTASAVNQLDLTNSATGNPVILGTSGGDTNIGLKLLPKGTGQVVSGATIVSDTDATDDIGTSATKWLNSFTQRVVLEDTSTPSTPSSGDYATYGKAVGSGSAEFGIDDQGNERQLTPMHIRLIDSKTANTAGGTSSNTTWNARDLNTEEYDPLGLATISSNKFVLVAGLYKGRAYSTFLGGTAANSSAQNRIFNVTTATEVNRGENATAVTNSASIAIVDFELTSNGTDEYRVDTYTTVGRTTNGLGLQLNNGNTEKYTVVVLEKIG